MKLSEMRQLQEKITSYREFFKSRISKSNTLDPDSFLSTDTACYKLLDSWYKDMLNHRENYEAITKQMKDVEEYKWFLDYWKDIEITQENQEEFEISHLECSMGAWEDLLENNFGGELYHELAVIIVILGMMEEFPSLKGYEAADLYEPSQMSFAIVLARQGIKKGTVPEKIIAMIRDSEAYRDFFRIL